MSRTPARPLVVLAAALALSCAGPLAAQGDYPNRPVKVVVPFSPGGAVDGPMRMVAQELSKRLGQQVVVENKPGAGATIGTEIVAKAPRRRLHAAARVADQRDQRDDVHRA